MQVTIDTTKGPQLLRTWDADMLFDNHCYVESFEVDTTVSATMVCELCGDLTATTLSINISFPANIFTQFGNEEPRLYVTGRRSGYKTTHHLCLPCILTDKSAMLLATSPQGDLREFAKYKKQLGHTFSLED